jgi:hypothetical protein
MKFKCLRTRVKHDNFLDVVPCSLVEVEPHFRGAYCLHNQGDDGGSMHL